MHKCKKSLLTKVTILYLCALVVLKIVLLSELINVVNMISRRIKMDTKELDDYIKDLNEEYDKYNKKLIQPLAYSFIVSKLFKEIERAKDFKNAVKGIKDYGCKKVGDYLYAEIFVTPCRAYIQFSFSEGVPEFDEDDQDTEEYLLRRVKYMLLSLIKSSGLGATFEMEETSQRNAFLNAIKYIFEPTYAQEATIDTIVNAIVDKEEGIDL